MRHLYRDGTSPSFISGTTSNRGTVIGSATYPWGEELDAARDKPREQNGRKIRYRYSGSIQQQETRLIAALGSTAIGTYKTVLSAVNSS
jgi:hypothetical protein